MQRKFARSSMSFTCSDATVVMVDMDVVLISDEAGLNWRLESILHDSKNVRGEDDQPILTGDGFTGQVVETVRIENSTLVAENNKLRKKNAKLKQKAVALEAEISRFHAAVTNKLLEEPWMNGSGREESTTFSAQRGAKRSSSPKSSS